MLRNETLQPGQADTAPKIAKSANMQALGFILISVFLNAIGQLVFKAALNSLGTLELSLDMILRMALNPLLILGLIIYVVSTFTWLISLSKADLSFAYPFLSLTYFVVLIGGAMLFNDQITAPRVIGFAVVVIGLIIVARSEQKQSAARP